MKRYIPIVLILISLVFGIVIGKMLFQDSSACGHAFLYINPKLNCGKNQVIDKANPIDLKAKLTAYITKEKNAKQVEEVAVYFRDLQDGPILGINENTEFIPASLLKLPVALTFYRLVEEEQSNILTRRLRFEASEKKTDDIEQFYKPTKSAQPNTYYTVEELINMSLVYSDNVSHMILLQALQSIAPERNLVIETYRELGLVSSSSISQADMSTRLYATMFRILYNASYLTRSHSEDILSKLTESDFDAGIAAGVPKDIKIANKFGERFLGEKKQLHDCGIVYYPDNPYLLCVMTRGHDFSHLSGIIGNISKVVYEDINTKKLE